MIANLCQEWSKVSTSSLWEKPDDQTNSEHIDARAFGVMYTWGGSSLVDRDRHSWLELMHTETKRKFVPRSVASFWNKCKNDGIFHHSQIVGTVCQYGWEERQIVCETVLFSGGLEMNMSCFGTVFGYQLIVTEWHPTQVSFGGCSRCHLEWCSTLSMLFGLVWSFVCLFCFVLFCLFVLFVCLFVLFLCFIVCFIVHLIDWLIDWSIDWWIDGLFFSLFGLFGLSCLFVWAGRWGGAGRPQKTKQITSITFPIFCLCRSIMYWYRCLLSHLCCLIFVTCDCDIMFDISRLSLCCGNSWVQQNNIFLVWNTSGRGCISRFYA